MNVIFLDLDGPAWPDITIARHPLNSTPYPGDPDLVELCSYWKMCDRFAEIWAHINKTYIFKTVISSTWRKLVTPEQMVDIFRTNGLTLDLHDDWRTGFEPHKDFGMCDRWTQVSAWLERHPETENWMCLDDELSGWSLVEAADDDKTLADRMMIIDYDRGIGLQDTRKMIRVIRSWFNLGSTGMIQGPLW